MCNNETMDWIEIPDFEYWDVCGQAVRPKGKGSHRRKHEGEVVSYSLIHPNATGVNIDFYLVGYTPSHPISAPS